MDGAVRVTTYDGLDRYIRAFASGAFNLLVLVGAPGLQKSRVVRDAMPDACWIEGHATAMGIYKRLWEFRDQPVVIDDVDSLYADRAAVRLLKGLCQTDRRKTVAWESDAPALRREGIPRRFTTSSRVLIVANAWKTLNVHVTALEDRGHLLHGDDGDLYLVSGYHLVNRIGYLISTIPLPEHVAVEVRIPTQTDSDPDSSDETQGRRL